MLNIKVLTHISVFFVHVCKAVTTRQSRKEWGKLICIFKQAPTLLRIKLEMWQLPMFVLQNESNTADMTLNNELKA